MFSPPKTPPPGSPVLSQAAARPTGEGGEGAICRPPPPAPLQRPPSTRRGTAGVSRGETLRAVADHPAPPHPAEAPRPGRPAALGAEPRGMQPFYPTPTFPGITARRGCPERRKPIGKVTPRWRAPVPPAPLRSVGRCLAAPGQPGEAPRGAAGGPRTPRGGPGEPGGGCSSTVQRPPRGTRAAAGPKKAVEPAVDPRSSTGGGVWRLPGRRTRHARSGARG